MIELLFFFRCVLDLLPFPTIKLPKLKKLRQWSHDSLVNLSQLTNRTNNVNPKFKSQSSYDESSFPTNGISTISSAIREQKIDPNRDNLGLYALKCDRSSSMANARRGILLNLPTAITKSKAELNSSFQSMERTHEVFRSCEKIVDPNCGIMYDGASSSASATEGKMKIEPPPRKKRRPAPTRNIVAHQKPVNKPVLKQANQNILQTEQIEKNDSALYRTLNANGELAKVSVEEPKKKEHVVTMVKPKVQKAVVVKAKPIQQQVAKVKSYEWNKHQRKSSVGNAAKPHFTKRYVASESSSSIKSEHSVDIFQSNKLLDQKKMFDEFDALFDRSKECEKASHPTPASAFSRLNALKFPSSSFSHEIGIEEKNHSNVVAPKSFDNESQDFCLKNFPMVPHVSAIANKNISSKPKIVSEKPKIISEQPKAVTGIVKKKILYYDDKHEIQQLIMNQTQSTTIINNHFNAAVVPSAKNEGTMPISCSPESVERATGPRDLNGNVACEDYQRPYPNPKTSDTTNSNSLRIFSNEGIFVFNL